jgi:hypothetical protein
MLRKRTPDEQNRGKGVLRNRLGGNLKVGFYWDNMLIIKGLTPK